MARLKLAEKCLELTKPRADAFLFWKVFGSQLQELGIDRGQAMTQSSCTCAHDVQRFNSQRVRPTEAKYTALTIGAHDAFGTRAISDHASTAENVVLVRSDHRAVRRAQRVRSSAGLGDTVSENIPCTPSLRPWTMEVHLRVARNDKRERPQDLLEYRARASDYVVVRQDPKTRLALLYRCELSSMVVC